MAVETGQLGTVELLLNLGAKVDALNCYGQTPINIAQILKKTKILDRLRKSRMD